MNQFEIPPISITPLDQYNQQLLENLHPPDWKNPEPAACYNLVVIGGGTAGLVTAAGAGLLGAKVALVEKHLLGGDCTNVGCVPSKAIIRSARVAATMTQAASYGIQVPEINVDFAAVMERMRRVRAEISHHDSVERFCTEFGVDVFLGKAQFASSNTVEVEGKSLRFKKAVIATGSRPATPEIKGLAEAGYLTNETLFNLTQIPPRLAVIGGGYIGCEMAQTFRRLGAEVVLLQRGERLLKGSDPEGSVIMQTAFADEGINVVINADVRDVEQQEAAKILHYNVLGIEESSRVDDILVAVGRTPNIEGLNLEKVGVEFDPKQGIKVNDFLQTTNPKIYAVGDVCLSQKFTHAADAAARIVVQNALFSIGGIGRKKLSSLVIPSCTYTDPEVAQVGITLAEIQRRPERVQTFYISLDQVDRAIINSQTKGFAKVHIRRGRDQILGATVVAPDAGEIITQVTLAMRGNLGLSAISNTIYPYPTQAEVIRKVGNSYNLRRLKGWMKKIASFWLALQR